MNHHVCLMSCLLFLLSGFSGVVLAASAESETFYQEGLRLEREGQAAKAVNMYDKAIKSDPTFATPYCAKARILFLFSSKTKSREMLNSALEHFKVGLQLDEKNTTCYQARAVLWEEQKFYKEAIADYLKILEIKPQDLGAHMALAQTYRHNNQLKEALEVASKAIALTQPGDFRSYVVRGNILSYMKDYSAAIADYTEAIQRAPKEIALYYNRALAYMEQENYAAAVADYTQIIEKNPQHLRAYLERGFCYFQLKQCIQGKADFQKACDMGYQQACQSMSKFNCQPP